MSGGAATLPVRNGGKVRARSTTAVAWTPSDGIDVHSWLREGHRLGGLTRCSQWWLGDWIRYGTTRWGEKYKQAAKVTGYDVQTLRNIAYVAGQIPASRRRDNLTWSHHAEVCALEPDEQDKWLDLAAEQRMSVADLRIELRGARREEEPAGQSKSDVNVVECPSCEHRFEVPAKGMDAGQDA
jgi:hypothetical protein